jgi:uncharacterized Zn finger protein (UPF0148 family)
MCPHGLLFCPICLGTSNPIAKEMRKRKSVKMTNRNKKRRKQKERKALEEELADGK